LLNAFYVIEYEALTTWDSCVTILLIYVELITSPTPIWSKDGRCAWIEDTQS
jgi:hypothetical protein